MLVVGLVVDHPEMRSDGARNLAPTLQGVYDFIMVLLMVRISAVCIHFLCLNGSLTVDFCPPHIKDAFYLLG